MIFKPIPNIMTRVNETTTAKDNLIKLLQKKTTKIYIHPQITPVRDPELSKQYTRVFMCVCMYVGM